MRRTLWSCGAGAKEGDAAESYSSGIVYTSGNRRRYSDVVRLDGLGIQRDGMAKSDCGYAHLVVASAVIANTHHIRTMEKGASCSFMGTRSLSMGSVFVDQLGFGATRAFNDLESGSDKPEWWCGFSGVVLDRHRWPVPVRASSSIHG